MKKMKQDGGKQDKLSQFTAGPDFCSKSVNESMITLSRLLKGLISLKSRKFSDGIKT